jgi:hypothetical protein
LELKSLWTFLAIKRCQRTKSKKVIKQSQILFKKLAHICAPLEVNSLTPMVADMRPFFYRALRELNKFFKKRAFFTLITIPIQWLS